jgi:hypothetical protein
VEMLQEMNEERKRIRLIKMTLGKNERQEVSNEKQMKPDLYVSALSPAINAFYELVTVMFYA